EASPFCLCLVAGRPPGELSRSLAKVSRAREVLDALDEGREHAGRWCRWASSALVAAESVSPRRSGADSAAAAGSRDEPSLPEDTESLIAAAATISEPPEDNQATGDVRDAMLRQTWCLQEGLERRVRAAFPPADSTPAAGSTVPSWLSAATAMLEPTRRDGSAPTRAGSLEGDELRRGLRRLAEGIDLRLGETALTTTLEEQRIQRQRQRQRQHTSTSTSTSTRQCQSDNNNDNNDIARRRRTPDRRFRPHRPQKKLAVARRSCWREVHPQQNPRFGTETPTRERGWSGRGAACLSDRGWRTEKGWSRCCRLAWRRCRSSPEAGDGSA
ncbi:unnamed protein product, partial [Ectocarpus sp. 8 AP-2014]